MVIAPIAMYGEYDPDTIGVFGHTDGFGAGF
jgi:hypothetical protein